MLKNLLVLPDNTKIFSGNATGCAIMSAKLTECVNSGTELTIGSVCSNALDITVWAPNGAQPITAGSEMSYYKVDDAGTQTKLGVFTAEQPTKSSSNIYKVTAYDHIAKTGIDLSPWLTANQSMFPITLYNFTKAVCVQCGLTLTNASLLNGDLLISAFASDDKITGRTLLGWVGEVCGCFCQADTDGNVTFAWYQTVTPTITPASSTGVFAYRQNSLTYEDYQTAKIDKVQIRLSSSDVGTIYPANATGKNAYQITGNYLLRAKSASSLSGIAQSLYERLKDISYTPCKCKIDANLVIRAGTIVPITDANGRALTSYIMSRTEDGMTDTLSCTGSRDRSSCAAVNEGQLKALEGKVLNLRTDVDGLSVENKNLAGDVASIQMSLAGISTEVTSVKAQAADTRNQVDTLNGDMTTLTNTVASKTTATEVDLQIQEALSDGVKSVTTETGFTFNKDGLTVAKSGANTKTQVDETGIEVDDTTGSANAPLLFAGVKDGKATVETQFIEVSTYIKIGTNSRIQDYTTGRTGIFYVGS